MITFEDYDRFVQETDSGRYGTELTYPALGVAGEAGEYVDKVKKLWRNKGIKDGASLNPEDRLALIKELSDICWYISASAKRLNSSFREVIETNIQKLTDRRARGVIKSEGDDR